MRVFLLLFFILNCWNPLNAETNKFVQFRYFDIKVPDSSTLMYEDGEELITWSVVGTIPPSTELLLVIENEKGKDKVAAFNGNSHFFQSNWNGSVPIVFQAEGKFKLIAKIQQSQGIISTVTLGTYEVKYRTVYSLDGEASIFTNSKSRYEISPITNIKDIVWSVSEPSVKIEKPAYWAVNILSLNSGNVSLKAELTLVTGDKKVLTKNILINSNPLNNVALEGDENVIFTGKPLVYKLTGAPTGSLVVWNTDSVEARVTKGQNTNEVSLSLMDINKFQLSATISIAGLTKKISKIISVNYKLPYKVICLNSNKNVKNGDVITYRVEGIDKYWEDSSFKLVWSTKNMFFEQESINENPVKALVFGNGKCQAIASLIWGNDTVKISNSDITTSYPDIEPLLTNLSFSSRNRSFTIAIVDKNTQKPQIGTYNWSIVNLKTPVDNIFNKLFYYHPGYDSDYPWDITNPETDFRLNFENLSPLLKINVKHATSTLGFYKKTSLLHLKTEIINEYGKRDYIFYIKINNFNKTNNFLLLPAFVTVSLVKSAEVYSINESQVHQNEIGFDEGSIQDITIYSVVTGQLIYSAKRQTNLNIMNLNIRKGFYILERRDLLGNQKREKIYIP